MANRIEATVTMTNIYEYEAPAFGYGYETRYIYTMTAEDGTVYVWKTTAFMTLKVEDPDGWEIDRKGRRWNYLKINSGDIIKIAASIKGESEYKGQPQTELTRVKVIERTFKAETPEERAARIEKERKAKAQEQRDSLIGQDFIWTMPYKQFKEHYADCETVEGSFERHRNRPCTIAVIIREGRLKASGVRGEHYSGYSFLVTDNGEKVRVVYRAVNEENAEKRCKKDFPAATEISLDNIYHYNQF